MSSPATSPRLEAKGFLTGLFDFSFTTFITLKFLRVIYAVLLVLILLTGLVFLVAGLSEGGATAVLSLLFVPVFTLLYLVLARIYLELVALLFRIGENTSIMAQALVPSGPAPHGEPGAPPAGGQPGYGPPA